MTKHQLVTCDVCGAETRSQPKGATWATITVVYAARNRSVIELSMDLCPDCFRGIPLSKGAPERLS